MREVLARGPVVVDICPAWRASLVAVDAPGLHDLTDPAACTALGADPALGDSLLDTTGYTVRPGPDTSSRTPTGSATTRPGTGAPAASGTA